MCCLAREDAPGELQIVLVDCSEDLRVVSSFSTMGFSPWQSGCLSAGSDGSLSIWDVSANAFTLAGELPRAHFKSLAPAGPVMIAGCPGRFIAACAPQHPDAPLWAHDLQALDEPLNIAKLSAQALGFTTTANEVAKPTEPTFQWSVELIHAQGPLLVVIARVCGAAEWTLTGDDTEADSSAAGVSLTLSGPRIFAWHLPSCRPLLAGHPTPQITTFARSGVSEGGRLAFAGSRTTSASSREGRSTHYVVVPGAGTVRRPSRRSGLIGPLRRAVNSSDLRARGLHKRSHCRR